MPKRSHDWFFSPIWIVTLLDILDDSHKLSISSFCYTRDEAYRVKLPNSRNPRVSHRVGKVNLRIKPSSIFKLFIVHHIFRNDPMTSPPLKHPSKIPGSYVRVIERILGSHKNYSCILYIWLRSNDESLLKGQSKTLSFCAKAIE